MPWFLVFANLMEAFRGALQFMFCLVLPGLGWGWILPRIDRPGGERVRAGVARIAGVILIGLLASLFLVLFLAEFGLLRRPVLWCAIVGTTVCGLAAGWIRDRSRVGRHLAESGPGAAILGAGLLLLLLLPNRGEWLAGGWDPGVYVNEGVQVSRSGTFYPEPLPAYRVLARHGIDLLAGETRGFLEAFPGIPVDPATGAFSFYFYRASVAWHALCTLCCGPPGAVLAPGFAILLSLFLLAGFLSTQGLGTGHTALVLGLFCAQPILLYHSHTPCAEALELALAFGVAYAWGRRAEHPVYIALLATALFAACVNRPSFLFFGGILTVITAMPNLGRRDSLRSADVPAMLLGLGLAVLYYRWVTPQSVVKIPYVYRFILHSLVVLGGAALLFAVAGLAGRVRTAAARLRPRWLCLGAVAALILAGAWLYATDSRSALELRRNTRALLEYTSWPLAGLAAAGAILWIGRIQGRNGSVNLGGWVFFLMSVGLVTLARKSVAELYPWATKRYLLFAPATVAVLASVPFAALWQRKRQAAACALAGLLLASWIHTGHAVRIRDAWTRTEYNGLAEQLGAIAPEIGERDVVLADHFLWATPLCMAYGKQAFNGVPAWRDPARAGRLLNLFADLENKGMRVHILTSTSRGMGVFPAPLRNVKPVKRWPARICRTIAHHKRSRSFRDRHGVLQFRLYRWLGPGTE